MGVLVWLLDAKGIRYEGWGDEFGDAERTLTTFGSCSCIHRFLPFPSFPLRPFLPPSPLPHFRFPFLLTPDTSHNFLKKKSAMDCSLGSYAVSRMTCAKDVVHTARAGRARRD